MKLRYLANLALIVMPTLVLTWAVSAQGYSSPPDLAPAAPNAAPLDVVLVIDATQNQAYDPPSMAAYANRPDLGCDPASLGAISLDTGQYTNACVAACNAYPNPADPNSCQPFGRVKNAAIQFINQLRPSYDRVAVISIDRQPRVEFSLDFDLNAAKTAIANIRVSDHSPGGNPGEPCPYIATGGQRWKCTTNNLGRALWEAGAQFSTPPFSNDSRRVVITLASGAADSTDSHPSADPDTVLFGFCPGKDTEPICRDNRFAIRHAISDTLYDAEDYALDKADALATWPITNATSPGTQLFTIGFGRKIVCTGAYVTYNPGPPVVCVPSAGSPYVDPDTGYPNGGEQFLRYIAAIGDDGNPATDPCAGAPLGAQCGNYYFVPHGNGLAETYLHIASRLFGSPDFSAAPLTGPAPLTVNFTDQSVGEVLSRTWDFGDAVTSTQTNPTHTYALPGVYTVTLQISTALDVSVLTRTNYITVYTPVAASFNATPITGLMPLTVTFNNLSIGDYDTSLWDFGDGVTATTTNPTHTYTSRDAFSVTLTVSGSGGISTLTATNYITTYQPVNAAFTAQPISGTLPLTVTFTNQSTGDYAAVLWSFGDGLTSTVINPTHTYSLTGTYTVTLYMTGPGGTASLSRPDFISVQAPEWKFYLPLLMR